MSFSNYEALNIAEISLKSVYPSIYLSIYLYITRQFLEKRGFQKTPFQIFVELEIFFTIGLDNVMMICKVSSL